MNGQHRNDRIDVCMNLLAAVLVRIQERLSRRHLRRGMPQVAMFSFDHIGARINAFGRYEHDVLCALIAFLRQEGNLRGTCLDIGANIGNHALFFARHFEAVEAFEPSSRTFALLAVNTRDLPNVRIHRLGLSDSEGVFSLFVPLGNVGEGSVLRQAQHEGPVREERIEVVPLDTLADIAACDIGLVKVDVEGMEADVLRGARATLARCKPAVVFEQQPEDIENGTSPSIALLRELGYSRFHECVRSPSTPLRIVTIASKVLLGETVSFREVRSFERKYYPMIVALA